jgi:hypothetical protein
MTFISNMIASMRGTAARIDGNALTFAAREKLSGNASSLGSLKELQTDEVSINGKVHTGTFMAKFAGRMDLDARERMKLTFQKGLSGFDTFA